MTDSVVDFSEDLSNLGLDYSFNEADTRVDGKHILAVVRGKAAPIEEVSGNGNAYSEEAFHNAINIPMFREDLSNLRVYGAFGHDVVMDDKAVREGLASHILSDVFIENGHLAAEYLILGTPSGKILNTLLRAGSKVRVSIKAKGAEKFSNGVRYPDPDKFFIERIDFVRVPGFNSALPDLVESLQEKESDLRKPTENLEENTMGDENKQFEEHLKSDLAVARAELSDAVDRANSFSESLNKLTAVAGSFEEAQANAALLAKYRDLGTPEEIEASFVEGKKALTAQSEVIATYEEALAEAGSDEVEELESQMVQMQESLNAYQQIGSPEEISNAIDLLGDCTTALQNQRVRDLAAKHNVTQNFAESLLAKGLSLSDVDETLGQFAESVVKKPAPKRRPGQMGTGDFSESLTANDVATIPGLRRPYSKDFSESSAVAEVQANTSLLSTLTNKAKSVTQGE